MHFVSQEQLFNKMNRKTSVLIVIIITCITLILGYFASKVSMDPSVYNLLPSKNVRLERLQKKFGIKDTVSQYLFLSVEGDKNFTVKKLNQFKKTLSAIADLPEITRILSPFNFISFTSSGKRIVPVKMMEKKSFTSINGVRQFKEKLLSDPLAKNFVVSENGRILTAIFNNKQIPNINAFMKKLTLLTNPLNNSFTVHLSGEVPINNITGYYLNKDLRVLLFLSVFVMMVIFFISFRTKRAVLLPLLIVGTGMIWTTGFMSLAGFKFTIVSITIPTLLLAVGSSYTIHLLNEYYRNASLQNGQNRKRIAETLLHIKKTIFIASLTTVIGFSSLLLTSIAPVRQFGLSISIGIITIALLSLTLLPALFILLPEPPKRIKKQIQQSILTRFTMKVASYTVHHSIYILAGTGILIAFAIILYPHITRQTNYLSYYPQNDKVIRDTKFIIEHTGGSQTLNITLQAPNKEADFFLRPDMIQKIEVFENTLRKNPSVISLLSFNSIIKNMNKSMSGSYSIPKSRGMILLLSRYFRMISRKNFSLGDQSNLISADGSSITIFLKVYDAHTHQFLAEKATHDLLLNISEEIKTALPENITPYLWGIIVLYGESTATLNKDQIVSTIVSLLLVFIVTSLVLKNIYYGLISLFPIIMGIVMYYIILVLFKIPLDMTTALVTNVAIGVGLDDSIHFLIQYKRQQEHHTTTLNAILDTMEIAGRPIVLTTIALMFGLLVLCFASFAPIVHFGLLTALTLFSAMVSTIFLLPSFIILFNKHHRP